MPRVNQEVKRDRGGAGAAPSLAPVPGGCSAGFLLGHQELFAPFLFRPVGRPRPFACSAATGVRVVSAASTRSGPSPTASCVVDSS
jgi:hypothetical protein